MLRSALPLPNPIRMNKTVIGHLASLATYTIFGLNIVMCKDIANSDILTPYALFLLRAGGATLLFWCVSLFMPKEKVNRADMWRIVLASFIGLFVPQMTFLVAITMTTSIDTSILSSLTPIMTMFVSAIFLKEPITWKKVIGVALSFIGVITLILNTIHADGGVSQTQPMGIFLIFLNCLSFAVYLGAFRPLISRYSVVTFMKWMFLFTMLISLPFCLTDTVGFVGSMMDACNGTMADGAVCPPVTDAFGSLMWEVLYVVVFATFVAYFLIPIGQKNIRPTLVSMYSYVQPILAVIISISVGLDVITWQKVVAIVFVFTGVAIVNRSRALQRQ